MTLLQMLQAAVDFWRPKKRDLQKYIISDGKKHPVAIICPGGGYSMCCGFIEGIPIAKELNEMGYSALVVYYRCKEKARFPAPMDDLAWAVKQAFDHSDEWGLDMKGYSVWGSSAGGHLAASFGTSSMGYKKYGLPKPAAIILSYPVITMGELTHLGSRNNLLGKNASDEMIEKTSIEKQVDSDYPPTFVWYGEADNVVSPENSKMLFDTLTAHGVPCQLVSYKNVGHGTGLGKALECADWSQKAIDFWKNNKEEQ